MVEEVVEVEVVDLEKHRINPKPMGPMEPSHQ
ncbi:unnamed protein product, partial [Allacma fusca]